MDDTFPPFIESQTCDSHASGFAGTDIARLICAINKLNRAAESGEVELITFTRKRWSAPKELPPLIRYSLTASDSTNPLSAAVFDVSRYTGSYTTQLDGNHAVTIEIRPRWGAPIMAYLLQYTTGVYIPPDSTSRVGASSGLSEWLLVFVWKSLLNQALRRLHIPQEYRVQETNDRVFRGRLDVMRQIRENIADQSRFCCAHAPLTMDTTVNRAIRYTIHLLTRRGFSRVLSDVCGFDERLASLGVKSKPVSPAQIDSIGYTKLSVGYRPLMQVTKAIIRRFGGGRSESADASKAFFVDFAEIWENYIQAILLRELPSEYRVISPNETGGDYLVAGEKREIRPDLLIMKAQRVVAVLDAKCKGYRQIGQFENDGVSREDLYQLTTYLYHYGTPGLPIVGVFVSPGTSGEDFEPEPMTSNAEHRIGVLNLEISKWDSTKDNGPLNIHSIRDMERQFASTLREYLDEISALAERYRENARMR